MKAKLFGALLALSCVGAIPTHATTTTFSTEGAFQSALTSFTVIDTSSYADGTTVATISASIAGATFFGAPSTIRASDGLLLNGSGLYGATTPHVAINFDPGVNGVAVTSNPVDGGRIQIFDGLDGTGNMLGEVMFGGLATALFGGIISTDEIRSAVFTCDYNFDLICGLIDPTFGTVSAVPLPAAAWLFGSALFGLVAATRRRARTRPLGVKSAHFSFSC